MAGQDPPYVRRVLTRRGASGGVAGVTAMVGTGERCFPLSPKRGTPQLQSRGNSMRWCLTLLLGLLLSSASFAKDRDYPDGNFRIYVPGDWSTPSTLPKGLQAGFISPDRKLTVEVMAAHANGPIDTSDFFSGVRRMLASSFKFEPVKTLAGTKRPMEYMIAVNAKGQEMGTFVVADGRVLYMLRITSTAGRIETSAQIRAILKSFTILVPSQIPRNSASMGGR